MKVNTAELINQVEWLLNQMDQGQILRVLSYANRVFCQNTSKAELQQSSQTPHGHGCENHHPKNDRHQSGK